MASIATLSGMTDSEKKDESDGKANDVVESRPRSITDRVMSAQEDLAAVWKKAQPYIEASQPYFDMALPYMRLAGTVAMQAYEFFAAVIRPRLTDEMVQVAFAFVLLTLGGQFAMTIACVQAFKMSGWAYMKIAWGQLAESYTTAMLVLRKDEDGKKLFARDGKNVNKIGLWDIMTTLKEMMLAEKPEERQLAFKRSYVIMKCVDPNKILDAVGGLWIGIVAVMSTLRSRMVYCVSLGANIGHNFSDLLKHHTQDYLYKFFPEHKKWVDFALRGFCGLLGIMISLFLARVVSAFCSALQGATVITKVLFHYLNGQKNLGFQHRSNMGRMVYTASFDAAAMEKAKARMSRSELYVMMAIATCGFLFQLWTRFNLPFFLKVPLAPVYFLENVLSLIALY